LDEFAKIVKGYSRDLNGDGIMNEQDQWGLTENYTAVYHFITGAGESTASVGADGIPKINALTERHISVVEAFGNLLSDRNNVLIAGGNTKQMAVENEYRAIEGVFREGRGLMHYNMVVLITEFRNMEDDFGILPHPKYDEAQEEYATFTSDGWSTSFSIPNTDSDIARTGMILEVMAGYSPDTIRTAFIDTSLKSKFSRDLESEKMLDIIFSTKKYDWGQRFNWIDMYGIYGDVTINGFDKFVSSIESKMAATIKAMEKTIETYEDLEW